MHFILAIEDVCLWGMYITLLRGSAYSKFEETDVEICDTFMKT